MSKARKRNPLGVVMAYDSEGFPIARVGRDGNVMRFVDPCPFCGKKHIYGGTAGHRAAHCSPPKAPGGERGCVLQEEVG